MVVSKTMVLTFKLRRSVPKSLLDYYDLYSTTREPLDQILCAEAQQKLLTPVYQSCQSYGIAYCNCVSNASFPDAESCHFS